MSNEIKYYSQYEQDKFLSENIFKGKTGFFIEIGADDGVDKSNTYFFELSGWKGLCIEPSPSRFEQLKKNRKCECINMAVSSSEKQVEFMDITGYGKGLSGIVDHYDARHVDRIARETTNNDQTISKKKVIVNTARLDNLLADRNITAVDYCSIDVEGSEVEILKSIDFNQTWFDVFTIEDNYQTPAIREILELNNFELIHKIGPDLVYRNKKRM